MQNVSDGLQIDISQLSELGEYLTDSDFNSNFEKLNNEMSKVTDSWLDLEGEHFKTVFTSFITDAKQISDCVDKLGEHAKKMATSYQGTLDDHTSEMKSVLESIG